MSRLTRLPVDDIEPGFPSIKEGLNEFRRILQVAIEQHNTVLGLISIPLRKAICDPKLRE